MEVKIGVSDSPRELVFNSSQTPEEIEELVTAALSGDGPTAVLSLSDDKGRSVPGSDLSDRVHRDRCG